MTHFGEALAFLKQGQKISRAAWKPNKCLQLRPSTSDSMSYIELVYDDGRRAPWTPTRCDLLEEDWQVRGGCAGSNVAPGTEAAASGSCRTREESTMNIADHLFDLVQGVADRPDLDEKSREVARAFRFDIACAVQKEVLRLGLIRPVAEEPGDAVAGEGIDPGRVLKDALFTCLKAGITEHTYGGVMVAQDRFAWVRFTTEPPRPDGVMSTAAPKVNDVGAGEEGWRPIGTAPRDGTKILVWCSDGVFTAEWHGERQCWVDSVGWGPFGRQPTWDEPPWGTALWWMPLPADPSQTKPAAPAAKPEGEVYYRQGRRVPKNVYEGEYPIFMAATASEAARLVQLLNAGHAALALPVAGEPGDAAEGEGSRIAQALSEAEWPDVSIGNKALIQAAIQALRQPPVPKANGVGTGEEGSADLANHYRIRAERAEQHIQSLRAALAAKPEGEKASAGEDEKALCLRSARMFIGWPNAFKDRLDKADTNEALIACSEELAAFLLRHRMQVRAAAPKANGVGTGEEGLDARLKAAGMFTVTEMLGVTPMTKWQTHSGMNSLQAFEQWLDRRSAEFLRMKAGYELGDKLKDDELYEWTLAHCAAFSEVRTNLKAALAAKPEGEKASAGIKATEITLGEGLVDITRITHQGRSGVLFRPRVEAIPFGEPGELQPGDYWPVAGDVVLWVSGNGPGVAIDALAALTTTGSGGRAEAPCPNPEQYDKGECCGGQCAPAALVDEEAGS